MASTSLSGARACPRCAGTTARTRYDFGRERIVRCVGCELMYLDPWPTEESLRDVYGDAYFQNPGFLDGHADSLFGYSDYIAERLTKQAEYVRVAQALKTALPGRPHPRLLEVGCGFGYFLDVAFEEGFAVTGVEFNQHAVERLRRKYAFPIHADGLEKAALPDGGFDAVALFDVIEHLRDPFAALDKLHRALVPGGVLAVSTMDAESIVSRLLGKRLEDFRRTREHLYFLGRKTLAAVLDERGFDVYQIRSVGHTFELAFLLDRLALYQRAVFRTLRAATVRLGLGGLRLRINPGTKMIAYARRRG